MNTHNIMRLMPEVLAALKATGQNMSLAKDLEAAIEHDRKGRGEPVAYRSWDDHNSRWTFTLWPAEADIGPVWEPLYAAQDAVELPSQFLNDVLDLCNNYCGPTADDCTGDYAWVGDIWRTAESLLKAAPKPAEPVVFDFAAHLQRQRDFSERTFGPGARVTGVTDHIRKELLEVELSGGTLVEWVDVIILALDGAWRSGASPKQIIEAIVAKQTKNERRTWPDWRTADPNKAIEHDRNQESASQPAEPVAWLRSDQLRKLGHPGSDSPLNERTDSMLLHAKGTPEAAAKYGFDVPVYRTPVAAQPSVPEGWRLVPLEPTNAMIDAGAGRGGLGMDYYEWVGRISLAWSDMLGAAPTTPNKQDPS